MLIIQIACGILLGWLMVRIVQRVAEDKQSIKEKMAPLIRSGINKTLSVSEKFMTAWNSEGVSVERNGTENTKNSDNTQLKVDNLAFTITEKVVFIVSAMIFLIAVMIIFSPGFRDQISLEI